MPKPTEAQIEAAAKYLAEEIMHYAWDGLNPEGRSSDPRPSAPDGYPAWGVRGHFNARQQDYKDAVTKISEILSA